ncbi:MAG: hypothetical protein Hals2KO_14010 [Halioglobus sp.]
MAVHVSHNGLGRRHTAKKPARQEQQEAVVTEEAQMADNNRNPSETETIMMALDQISQTIEVMTSVVGRLRTYVQEQDAKAVDQNGESKGQENSKKSSEATTEIQSDRILH